MCFYSLKYIYLIVLGLTVTFRGELEGAWKTCSGESAAEGKTLSCMCAICPLGYFQSVKE